MFNYDDVGEKIKGLAKWVCIFEAIISIIIGILLITKGGVLSVAGIATVVLGPIIAWVSSWLLYGFGEIVSASVIYQFKYSNEGGSYFNTSNAEEMRELEKRAKKESEERDAARMNAPIIEINRWGDGICPVCYKPINLEPNELHANCPKCKAALKTKRGSTI